MKKLLVIFAMLLVSTVTFAEEGDKWVGINLNYGFNNKYHSIRVRC